MLTNYLTMVGLGFLIGNLTGLLGVGGGFIITPVLLMLKIPANKAIGTSLVTLTLASFIAVIKHSRLGNVDFKRGIISAIAASAGMSIGVILVSIIKNLWNLDLAINLAYMMILYIVALYSLKESVLAIKGEKRNHSDTKIDTEKQSLTSRLGFIKLAVTSILTGILAGFLGAGGGFLYVPLFIYILGFPTLTAIGTSLFTVFISGIVGAIGHFIYGNIDLITSLLLFIGMSMGVQTGASLTKMMRASYIRFMYSLCIWLTAISLTFRLSANLLNISTLFMIGQVSLVYGISIYSIIILIYGIISKIKLLHQKNK